MCSNSMTIYTGVANLSCVTEIFKVIVKAVKLNNAYKRGGVPALQYLVSNILLYFKSKFLI